MLLILYNLVRRNIWVVVWSLIVTFNKKTFLSSLECKFSAVCFSETILASISVPPCVCVPRIRLRLKCLYRFVITFAASFNERRRYCGGRRPCVYLFVGVSVCVCPPSCDCEICDFRQRLSVVFFLQKTTGHFITVYKPKMTCWQADISIGRAPLIRSRPWRYINLLTYLLT